MLMAQAFSASRFRGFDTHAVSVAEARRLAAEAGLGDRVAFELGRANDYPGTGYDLICFFDCLHDMGDPIAAATQAARALARDGTVMLVEPFANYTAEPMK
jgi:SAM-dependent methyltransferase